GVALQRPRDRCTRATCGARATERALLHQPGRRSHYSRRSPCVTSFSLTGPLGRLALCRDAHPHRPRVSDRCALPSLRAWAGHTLAKNSSLPATSASIVRTSNTELTQPFTSPAAGATGRFSSRANKLAGADDDAGAKPYICCTAPARLSAEVRMALATPARVIVGSADSHMLTSAEPAARPSSLL